MTGRTIKCFCCDLNWSRFDTPTATVVPSAPQDWAFVDPVAYLDWHRELGNNVAFCQAYAFGGYAFYPTRLGPVAPGPGAELLPRLLDLARRAGMPFWSYFCVGADLATCVVRPNWIAPGSNAHAPHGFLAPESPWTDLLCARVEEFLRAYPVDWLLFDWFVYGSLRPDEFRVEPAWFAQEPFQQIVGRPMPETAAAISPEESLLYKRETLARQFHRLRDAVKAASPATRILFNVPYWRPEEAIWVNHPMLNESDGLFAECSRDGVVEWLLRIRKPHQIVITTILGRMEEGECDPGTWRKWHERGCHFFGYACGTPPDFRPHPSCRAGIEAVREAFRGSGNGARHDSGL